MGKDIGEDEIEIVTTQNIVSNGSYNDFGFLVRGKELFLVEVQSTKCPNIVFRIDDILHQDYQEENQELQLQTIRECVNPRDV